MYYYIKIINLIKNLILIKIKFIIIEWGLKNKSFKIKYQSIKVLISSL